MARLVTFNAKRDPMFRDEQGNGWVPLATYDERCDEIKWLREALERFVAWDGSEQRSPEYLSENLIPAARATLDLVKS
jgi:hypothetical protein